MHRPRPKADLAAAGPKSAEGYKLTEGLNLPEIPNIDAKTPLILLLFSSLREDRRPQSSWR